jgi:peptidoglycan/LPS O-acetylase OafA/YrhL
VRAIAVTMVLLLYGGVSWMNVGYFGVSVFFTLPDFLISSLLCSEFSSAQRVAPGAFDIRRAKRLLPANDVCLSVLSMMPSTNAWTAANHVR